MLVTQQVALQAWNSLTHIPVRTVPAFYIAVPRSDSAVVIVDALRR
jgi:hypothetical protein